MNVLDDLIKNGKLSPEIETGNIEYKLKLDENTRLPGLVTQMKWRINEGKQLFQPYAIYLIGIKDNGTVGDLDNTAIKASLKIFKYIVKQADAKIDIIKVVIINNNKTGYVACAKVSFIDIIKKLIDYRIAFVGNTGVGKTTLIGALTYGIKDDGKGKGRYNILKYKHEQESGCTSSIKYEFSRSSE